MSVVQCPVCALRFHYQSELEVHAREDHCHRELTLPEHPERPEPAPEQEPTVTSKLLRYP